MRTASAGWRKPSTQARKATRSVPDNVLRKIKAARRRMGQTSFNATHFFLKNALRGISLLLTIEFIYPSLRGGFLFSALTATARSAARRDSSPLRVDA